MTGAPTPETNVASLIAEALAKHMGGHEAPPPLTEAPPDVASFEVDTPLGRVLVMVTVIR